MNKFIKKEVLLLPEVYIDGFLIGHTDNYLKVKVKGDRDLLNKIIKVEIIENCYPYLIGEIKNK